MARLNADDRRRQILAAAREVFLAVGPEGARVSQIAEHAGVNQALLYRFFDSKEAMFEAAVIEPLDEALAQLLADMSGQLDVDRAHETVRMFFRTILGIFDDAFELFSIALFSDRRAGHEFYATRIVPFLDRLAVQIDDAGDRWPQSSDARLTVPMSLGMCWGVVMDAHLREIEVDLDTVADQLAVVLVCGLFGRTED